MMCPGCSMGTGTLLVWMLLVLAVLAGAILLVGGIRERREGRTAGGPERALEILAERFARGEIDREEFEERRRVLQSSSEQRG